ncbi:glycosyltransferase family A protein [Cognataquiflexum rubidum]|uniref:glycosyltransferase family A protein n=1 Tax=Cognataquiflexum rubidum TaxID=2922273 RepID=UPI001F13C4ED|nr:glycosyltransferase family A protein [Cognataquiflexum rubidum]MCH6234044.1 glycosyltransferase family 2 protein [Cognataquiflexum rubidum]
MSEDNSYTPLVSVIIPNYNRKKELVRALHSVFHQTYKNMETIVVDDCSFFSNAEYLLEKGLLMDDICVFRNSENRGLAYTRNRGIAEAKGELIAFLDSDDYWELEKIEKQVALFREDPNLDMVYCDTYLIINGVRLERNTKFFSSNLWRHLIEGWKPPNPSTLMMRKGCFIKSGLFSEELRHHEDFDFWLRAADRLNIGYCTEILSNFSFDSKDRLSNDYKIKFERTYKFLKKWESEITAREGKQTFQKFKKNMLSTMAIESFNSSFKHRKFQNVLSVYFRYLITDLKFYRLLKNKILRNLRISKSE